MWRQDTISIAATTAAVMISVYISTFDLGLVSLMPAILLVAGIALQLQGIGFEEPVEGEVFSTEGFETVMYGVLAIAVISIGGFLTARLPLSTQLSVTDAMLLGSLMAVAEEQFFRGYVTQWLISKMGPSPGILLGAVIFTVYHLAVYHTSIENLLYVLIAGMILGWTCNKTGRISPAILAHCINNLLVVVA